MGVSVTALGQVGYIFEFNGTRIVIDPYLSDFVADIYGDHLKRPLQHSLYKPDLSHIDALLLTHAHEDHCDPITIANLLKLNSKLKIYGAYECREVFEKHGISLENFTVADSMDFISIEEFSVTTVPAAHTQIEYNVDGNSRYLGFLIQVSDLILYHAGDTIPDERINQNLPNSIDFAFLPINERNYFRDKSGIVGNMTCREALQWASELTFQPNSTYKEELEFLYYRGKFDFKLQWVDFGQTFKLY
jgi:L-ascorbate 6-phosphate lactonase